MPYRQPFCEWKDFFCALAGECEGQDLVEYCLLIAVVVVGSAIALQQFQNVIGNVWSMFSNSLNGGS